MNRISDFARVMQGVSLVVRAASKYRTPPEVLHKVTEASQQCVVQNLKKASSAAASAFGSNDMYGTVMGFTERDKDMSGSSNFQAQGQQQQATAAGSAPQPQQQGPAFYFDSFQTPFQPQKEPISAQEPQPLHGAVPSAVPTTPVAAAAVPEKPAPSAAVPETPAFDAEVQQLKAEGVLKEGELDAKTVLHTSNPAESAPISAAVEAVEEHRPVFREHKIPSSPMSRMFGFSKLGAQLAYGTAVQWFKNKFSGGSTETPAPTADAAEAVPAEQKQPEQEEQQIPHPQPRTIPTANAQSPSPVVAISTQPAVQATPTAAAAPSAPRQQSELRRAFVNEDNAERLASTLCRMRGAALKLGQMFSILDDKMLPEPILRALERVRNQADIMPRSQLEKQLVAELGEGWREKHFQEFDMIPIAAASIGQVHRAVLKDGTEVAVKVQYPGVAESIDSDIKNVMRLVSLVGGAPGGAFLDKSIGQARKELKLECDYTNEANNQKRFRQMIEQAGMSKDLIVPRVFDHVSTKRVLTTEMIPRGSKSIEQLANSATQEERNRVAGLLLKLCLRELFEFRYMQTDPNWSNFYYDKDTGKLYLLDFGACLEFPKKFVDEYVRVVWASARKDKQTIIEGSRKMGFLTGEETQIMNDAHAEAVIIVGEPFSRRGIYNFESQLMTDKVKSVIPTMLKHRLTPPPPVTYSLHRKLSGTFLLSFKLRAQIDSRSMMEDICRKYQFEPENANYTLPID